MLLKDIKTCYNCGDMKIVIMSQQERMQKCAVHQLVSKYSPAPTLCKNCASKGWIFYGDNRVEYICNTRLNEKKN